MNFRELTKDNADEWFAKKGFVKRADGSWHKPRRVVSRVYETQSPHVERIVRDAPLEPVQRETYYPGRCAVSIVSYRRRLCDPDGLIGKWFLDAIRFAGLIREDDAGSITYTISQVKVRTKDEEGTEIVITPL